MSPCLHIIAHMDMDMAPCPYIGYGYDSMHLEMRKGPHIITHMDLDMAPCTHIITDMDMYMTPCLHICHFKFIIPY